MSVIYKILFQLTEGRKTVGGKLEVKIRVRDPFKSKQVEETKEKWLIIDQFLKTLHPSEKVINLIRFSKYAMAL